MSDHIDDYTEDYTATALTEYFVKATVDYWTAITFPAIYFARYL